MSKNQALSNIVIKMAREQWKHETKQLVEINVSVLLIVLHDKFGFGEERCKKLMAEFRNQCESFYKEKADGNQVDISELFDLIREELGINIEEELREEY